MVPWFEWSDEAFRLAQEQNKPVMLFLAAFWCGYCQRMDQEAFSETENIALLKAYFISIRVDNAQRPDIDCRYNQKGWPTVVFMTPQGEPIVAANYLPSDQFEDLLLQVYMGYQQSKSAAAPQDESSMETAAAVAPTPVYAEAKASILTEITDVMMALADAVNGGYGSGQKFIQAEANDFLLSRYQATKDSKYLDHVCLTLDRMREGAIHDREAGAYFRTTTGADWSRPHREKILAEQAGLLGNCLWTFRLTQKPVYAAMAEDIITYLNRKLFNPENGTFYGCEDFLRTFADDRSSQEFYTILDPCVYTDANAKTIAAYLDASVILGKADCQERALGALAFLWDHCRDPGGGMYHYFDGAPHVHGLLNDQAQMGSALLMAHAVTGDGKYLEQGKELAAFISARLKNPSGGYYDIASQGPAYLKLRLKLIEQSGPTAAFFLGLADATGDLRYREAALWGLRGFPDVFSEYGIHAATFGQALQEFLCLPQKIS